MVTDQNHSSDVSSEQEVIRYTEKLAQSLGLDEQNTRAYKALSGQIWALEKRLEDYHIKYVKLKRKVNLLEDELEDELDDLDECVDRETVVNLIQKIVPSLVREKSLIKNNPSSSSSDYLSDSDIDEIVNMIKHQRIQKQIQKRQAQRKDQEKNTYNKNKVEENIPVEASIDTSTDVNCISQKHIGELGITYHSESNSIITPDASYSTLGKVNLHIGFNDGKKHKSTPSEFIVVGPDWPGPDLILGGPWFRENGATLDICNSKLLLDDNFAIPFKEYVEVQPTFRKKHSRKITQNKESKMSSTTSNIHLVCFVRGETGKDIFPVVIDNNSTVENLGVEIRKVRQDLSQKNFDLYVLFMLSYTSRKCWKKIPRILGSSESESELPRTNFKLVIFLFTVPCSDIVVHSAFGQFLCIVGRLPATILFHK
ncbi:unnamed protein product [Rhizophagus irregularis]|nr:unnamed protein product [Rhizophagus irregularis]